MSARAKRKEREQNLMNIIPADRARILALPPSYPETRRQIRQARSQPRADAIRKP